jgi:hypothetical protein
VSTESFTVERGSGKVVSEHTDIYEALAAIANKPPGWCVVDWRGIVLSYRSGAAGEGKRIRERNSAALRALGVKDLAELANKTTTGKARRTRKNHKTNALRDS